MKRILVVGATSAIAQATTRLWAGEGHRLYLVGRDAERLARLAADLGVRGAAWADHALLDANDTDRHAAVIDEAVRALGGLDIVLVAHGSLGDQRQCEADFAAALREFQTNAISVMSLLTHVANRFEAQRHGTLIAISSVAGDRGRQSNYVYGAAKAAVSVFLQGLRNRLHRCGVKVVTIKPGFVDTPMTAGFRKGMLWTQPEQVARTIVAAAGQRADVVYTPWFWKPIMQVVRCIPEGVFKTLHL